MASTTNVRVAVRVRPVNEREKGLGEGGKVCVRMEDRSTIITNPSTSESRTFTYDYSYGIDTEQTVVYNDLGRPILEKALEGYNGTIFAYGQTGAGKSFTMTGANDGIIPQMNKDMFTQIEELSSEQRKFLVTVSYLEIYQEKVSDLLNPSDVGLQIRESPSTGIFVEGLAEMVTKSGPEIIRLMDQGNKVRQQKELTEDSGDEGHGLSSKLNLVDLAGSERVASTGATGDRLKEGASINLSLSVLGTVINALADQKKAKGFIPYRDSKLTRLLKESLGGNAMTVMVAAISPAGGSYDETVSTLQYANRAKNIQNSTKKNEDRNVRIIKELRGEIEKLRAMLASTADGKVPFDPDKMKAMEDMIGELQQAKNQTWEEKERMSREFEEERKKNLEAKGIMDYVMANLRKENQQLTERLDQLQAERSRLLDEYKERKNEVEKTKDQLKDAMSQFTMRTEALKAKGEEMAQDEQREFSRKLDEKRAELQKENEKLKSTKRSLKEVTDKQRLQKEEMQAQSAVLGADSELRKAIEEDERQRLAKENERLLARERARMTRELEDEKKALEKKYKADTKGSTKTGSKDLMKLELTVAEERSANKINQAQIKSLTERLEANENALDEMRVQHELEMERQQLEHYQVFRRYREWVESERRAAEQRQRSLIEDAVQDAIFLSARNAQLEQELKELKSIVSGQGNRRGLVPNSR